MSNIYVLATEAAAFKKSTVLPPGVRIHRGTDPVTGKPIHLRWTGIQERQLQPKPVDPMEELLRV